MTTKNIGTINGVIICTVWQGGKIVAECADTPNARAYAYSRHPLAIYTQAHYPGWKAAIRHRRDESANRIAHAGWLSDDSEACYQAR